MVGVPSARRSRGAGWLLGLLLAAAPGAVAAEDRSIVLTDDSLTSMVADLDDDGVGEVIAVLRHPDDRNDLVVAAWTEGDGSWPSLGSSRIERWGVDGGGPQPARFAEESTALIALRSGSRTKALVATATRDPASEFGGGCCLSLSLIEAGTEGISARLVDGHFGAVDFVQVADLEDDGVDELVVSRALSLDDQGRQTSEFSILRQDGARFEREMIVLTDSSDLYLATAGESDGVAGDDLLFVDHEATMLVRVASQGGELLTDRTSGAAMGGRLGRGWVAGAADGMIAAVDEQSFTAIRWPRGGRPSEMATLATELPGNLLLLGEGPTARWLDLAGLEPSRSGASAIRIYGLDLELQRDVPVPDLTRRLWELNRSGTFIPESGRYLWEQAGPIPGGLGPNRPAFLGHGSLIQVEPDGSLTVREAAHLVGVGTLGVIGTEQPWLAVSGEWGGSGAFGYFGNAGYEPMYGVVAVVPFTDLLAPNNQGRPDVVFHGATVTGTGSDERLYTNGDSLQVTVSAAPGDVVIAIADRVSRVAEVSGTASVTVAIDPPGRADSNREFELSVLVIGATGITTGGWWSAEALRVGPEVTATAVVEPFSLRATIAGQVESPGSVTVDGRDVVLSPSGRFRVEVDAPAWPREVLVVARDPLGTEVTQRLEVIGFVDYRGLPWIPIVGTLTVVAGMVLFVRTPRLRPQDRLRPDGDGRLEEIDGDII